MMRVESLGTQCVRILHFVLVRTALYVYCPRHTLSIRITLYASPYTRHLIRVRGKEEDGTPEEELSAVRNEGGEGREGEKEKGGEGRH
jgi:hypothetical protein